jgi:hypothetical protein
MHAIKLIFIIEKKTGPDCHKSRVGVMLMAIYSLRQEVGSIIAKCAHKFIFL